MNATDAEVAFLPATVLAGLVRDRKVSSRELLDLYLDRVGRLNPALNAVVTIDADGARRGAARADAAAARREFMGPLHGVPATVKDELRTAGMRTTYGARRWRRYVPDGDVTPVARLRTAGAVVFGKTNLPILGGDLQTHNRIFGTTRNPWDPARTPGGSSGGSAAALAAGLTGFEIGTDMGGSVRTSAAYCGVYGHKPTGLVPYRGVAGDPPLYRSEKDLSVVGPFGRSAADLAVGVDVLAGPDDGHALAWRLELPRARHSRLHDFRIAAWLDDPFCPTSPDVLAALHETVAALSATPGVHVDTAARPEFGLDHAWDVFSRLLFAAISPLLPAPAALGPPLGCWPGSGMTARAVRGVAMPHAAWLHTDRARRGLQDAWQAFFRDFDVLLTPMSPVVAPLHDHRYNVIVIWRHLDDDGGRPTPTSSSGQASPAPPTCPPPPPPQAQHRRVYPSASRSSDPTSRTTPRSSSPASSPT